MDVSAKLVDEDTLFGERPWENSFHQEFWQVDFCFREDEKVIRLIGAVDELAEGVHDAIGEVAALRGPVELTHFLFPEPHTLRIRAKVEYPLYAA